MEPPLVVGLGRVGVAVSGLAPNLPTDGAPSTELAALATTPAPGIGVALRAAVRLGCRGRAVGSHGADLLGQLVRSAMREAGIDVELMRPTGASACELVTVAGDGTHRLRYPGRADAPTSFDPSTALAGAALVLIDTSAPAEQRRAAELARSRKIPVVLDVSELREGTSELVAAADILIISERVASELAPRGELTDALRELAALGPRAVVITLGEQGAIGRHGEQVVRISAFPAEALDTSGASAVFHGAFAAALLSELPFARCIELAAAAASLTVGELGPWDAVPRRDDVLALVRTRR